ncbi:MAG: spirocyclase AveC family protein [Marmoricola sp.]
MVALSASSPTLADPAGYLVWEIGITVAALVLLAVGVHRARTGPSPRLLLMVIASASTFWQETYGDWGAYVRYSDRFLQYPWPGEMWTASVKCWWFIAGYAVFYTALYGLLNLALKLVRVRFPDRKPYVTAILLAFPIFYLFDLCFEATTTYLGFWTYLHTFGPALHVGNGTFPLLWPILEQVPFIAMAALAIVSRDDQEQDLFERLASRVSSGPRRFAVLLGTWIVTTNVAFLLSTALPLLALRWIAGPDIPV